MTARRTLDDFVGKTAIVTGGTRGIGEGIAQELLARGANVVITARKPDDLASAVSRLDQIGTGRVLGVQGHAADEQHQHDAVAQAVERFGAVDLLVPNAAINPQYGALVDSELDVVRKVFDVNVVAVIGWTQQVWRQSMAERGGSILVVASAGGLRAVDLIGAYNASKAAVMHLVRQMSGELAPRVRVNAIAPALIKTRFAEALYEGREDEVAATYPMKRLGTPQDTASAAVFLLSDAAGWITGETLTIDGGALAYDS